MNPNLAHANAFGPGLGSILDRPRNAGGVGFEDGRAAISVAFGHHEPAT
jgi:hypothetical protein